MSPAASAPSERCQSRSAPQSVLISGASDLVHRYHGVMTSGQWTYTAWQFIPEGYRGRRTSSC